METGEPTFFSRSFFDENENHKSNQISKNGKKGLQKGGAEVLRYYRGGQLNMILQ